MAIAAAIRSRLGAARRPEAVRPESLLMAIAAAIRSRLGAARRPEAVRPESLACRAGAAGIRDARINLGQAKQVCGPRKSASTGNVMGSVPQ
jgi:hypothetical protein